MQKKHGAAWGILICTVSLTLILLSFYDFHARTAQAVRQQAALHLEEITRQAGSSIRSDLEPSLQEIIRLSDSLSQGPSLSDETLPPALQQIAANHILNRVLICSETEVLFDSASGVEIPIPELPCRSAPFTGEAGVSSVFFASTTGQPLLCLYAPILRNSAVVAGIFGLVSMEDLTRHIPFPGFQGEGELYLLQKDGVAFPCAETPMQAGGLERGNNFFDYLEKGDCRPSQSADELRRRMEAGGSGTFSYHLQNRERTAYYSPIGFQGWYLLSAVPADTLLDYSQNLSGYALTLTWKLLAVCSILLLLTYLWTRSNRRHLEFARAQAVGDRQKYEIALRHTHQHIFEYDYTHARLIQVFGPDKTTFPPKGTVSGAALFTAESQKELSRLFRSAAESEQEVSAELQLTHGEWLHMTVTAICRPADILLVGTVDDITQRKALEFQFHREEQHLKKMLEKAASGFSVDLESGRLLSSFRDGRPGNPTELRDCSYTQRLQTFYEGLHPDYREKIIRLFDPDALKSIHRRGVREISEHFLLRLPRRKDYSWVRASVHFLTCPQNGHPIIFSYLDHVNREKERELELEYRSQRDGLTGLYNRITFIRKANRLLKKPETSKVCALLMMDLDGFKNINDEYGHQAGDLLLCRIAAALREGVTGDQLVGRLGGDEFVIFLSDMPDRATVLRLAEQLCNRVEQLTVDNCPACLFTISIGVAIANPHELFETLYPRADKALYCAKREGKNRVVLACDEN